MSQPEDKRLSTPETRLTDDERELVDIFMQAQAEPKGYTFSANILRGIRAAHAHLSAAAVAPSSEEPCEWPVGNCRFASSEIAPSTQPGEPQAPATAGSSPAALSAIAPNVGGPLGWRKETSNEPLWDEPVLAYGKFGMRVAVNTPNGWREMEGMTLIPKPLWWRRLPEKPE